MARLRTIRNRWKRWGAYFLLSILGLSLLLGNMGDELLFVFSRRGRRLTALHKATILGNATFVKGLLLWGYDVNIQETHKDTIPLHWAACIGHRSVVAELLTNGADVGSRDHFDTTPLHYAAGAGHLSVVSDLLEHGADIRSRGFNGETPLFFAAGEGYHSLEPLWHLMRFGPPAVKVSNFSRRSRNPLNIQIDAAEKYKTVEYLLANGANPYCVDESGNTVLHAAARGGNPDIVALFISKGLDVNARNARRDALSDVTPLHYATVWCHSAVVDVLLAHGADPDAQDDRGRTPMDTVSKYCPEGEQKTRIIDLLHQYGAKVL
jgi:ankyrin repeat protein